MIHDQSQISNFTICSPPPLSILTSLLATQPYRIRVVPCAETVEEPGPLLAFDASRSLTLFNGIENRVGEVNKDSRRYAVKICWEVGAALRPAEIEETLAADGESGVRGRFDSD